MTMNETLMMTAMMLAPAFFSLIGMAVFGSPVVSLLGEITAKTKKRVFYDKYGQQTATMGTVLLAVFILVEAIGIALLYQKYPDLLASMVSADSPLKLAGIALAAFLLLGVPYSLTWKQLRTSKGIHMTMGFGACAAVIAMFVLGIPAKLSIAVAPTAEQTMQLTPLPLIAMYLFFMVAAAAGMSCAYLVIRRHKDDFGRDYYNFALKLASRWALIPMVGFLACQGWLFATLPEGIKTLVLETPLGIVWGASTFFGLLCLVIWGLITRSSSPLQIKGLTFTGVLLLWLVHTGNALLFVNFMSMS